MARAAETVEGRVYDLTVYDDDIGHMDSYNVGNIHVEGSHDVRIVCGDGEAVPEDAVPLEPNPRTYFHTTLRRKR